MKNIAEMRQQRANTITQARAILDKAETEKRAVTTEEETQYDNLIAEAERQQKEIEREERQQSLERELGERQQRQQTPAVIPGGIKEDLEPGIRMARYTKATLVSQKEGRSFEDVAKRMYPKDITLQEARAAMGAGTPSDGGVLVPDDYSTEIIPLLRDKSSIRALGARVVPMPKGNLKMAKQTGAANFMWVGENKPINASKTALGMMSLSAKKLAGLIPLSNELISDSSISADQFVRDELVNGTAESESITSIYGKGTENEPLGIKKLSSDQTDLGALPTSDTLGLIVGKVMAKKFPNKLAFGWQFNGVLWSIFYNLKDGSNNYVHRDEMNQGKLAGFKFEVNNNINVGGDAHGLTEIYFGDWSQFIVGETLGLQIAVSQEASYYDGGTLVSAFGNDQTVMRALLREDFGARYSDAFVVYNQVWSK